MKRNATIHITGIIQGVGFRPFVYRVAKGLSLVGHVLNLGDAGVRIVIEGEEETILQLVNEIKNNPPAISRIDTLEVIWKDARGDYEDFFIEKSSQTRTEGAKPVIPPDIAICDDCVEDLTSSESRWYHYPFTSCAACGPRYSTITDLPYDRPNTTMIDFPLCNICNTGYVSPLDRRYHAQTTACQDCGPSYTLLDEKGNTVDCDDVVRVAAELIDDGKILALQGIGGTHIATKVTDAAPIKILRKRKKRFQQPFAIMVRNSTVLKQITIPNAFELELLNSWRRPIVLVRKNLDCQLIPVDSLDQISPGLDTVGVMLPYAPLHHLLFQYTNEPAFVMTSANPTGVPMYINPQIIVENLRGVVDNFLTHNRRIHQRIDDSVIKVLSENYFVLIRRARGFVPEPIKLEGPWKDFRVLAVGPEEKATGAILKSERVYLTQHIGDTDRVESLEFLKSATGRMMCLLGVNKIDGIGCDLHPEFLSTSYAETLSEERDIPLVRVQHHHSHLASIIVDHKLDYNTSIVCITADGFGYGEDGKAWGGEILVGDFNGYTRRGGLLANHYSGGDLSARYAVRPLVGILAQSQELQSLFQIVEGVLAGPSTRVTEDSLGLLLNATKQKVNTIESTSAGRFLDAVALVLGVCSENSYDGECPMKLEAFARETDLRLKPKYVSTDYGEGLDLSEALSQIISLRRESISRAKIAYAAQWYLGDSLADIACRVSHENGLDYIGFSGGVALNRVITQSVVNRIRQGGKIPLIHRLIPPGDGGVSSGQIAVLAARLSLD